MQYAFLTILIPFQSNNMHREKKTRKKKSLMNINNNENKELYNKLNFTL